MWNSSLNVFFHSTSLWNAVGFGRNYVLPLPYTIYIVSLVEMFNSFYKKNNYFQKLSALLYIAGFCSRRKIEFHLRYYLTISQKRYLSLKVKFKYIHELYFLFNCSKKFGATSNASLFCA